MDEIDEELRCPICAETKDVEEAAKSRARDNCHLDVDKVARAKAEKEEEEHFLDYYMLYYRIAYNCLYLSLYEKYYQAGYQDLLTKYAADKTICEYHQESVSWLSDEAHNSLAPAEPLTASAEGDETRHWL